MKEGVISRERAGRRNERKNILLVESKNIWYFEKS
jgi:hypothetical protein